jgi:small-conductance mechanosensitive channel
MEVQKSSEQGIGKDSALPSHRVGIVVYAILCLCFLGGYYFVKSDKIDIGISNDLLSKGLLAACLISLILLIAQIVQRIATRNASSPFARYNLVRAIRLVAFLTIVFVLVSLVSENWYTAAVSLGLVSLLLGFALQTPISSLIAWLYIVIRTPYHIGDRIQIEDFKGDVVEINYLDTTLWEFGGDYLTNDLPSGRLIRFPNSLVLQYAIYNYSWKKFPYIWNEIPFHIAYESNLEYVESVLRRVTKEVLGREVEERIKHLKELIKKTPVDELEIKEYPYIIFRTNANTWVEVNVTYLVEPKIAFSIRTAIIKKALQELLKEPDKVMFPKSNAR